MSYLASVVVLSQIHAVIICDTTVAKGDFAGQTNHTAAGCILRAYVFTIEAENNAMLMLSQNVSYIGLDLLQGNDTIGSC